MISLKPLNGRSIRYRTPEQRMKAVNFDVCKNVPNLIGYHNNVPWATAKTYSQFCYSKHVTPYTERPLKIGPVVVEIFGGICRFLPSCLKRHCCYPNNLWGYWTDLDHIRIRCSYNIALNILN